MNATTIHRLRMARYQLARGCEELAKSSEFAAAQAVIHFHDALETVLIVVADEVGVAKRRIDFMDYVSQINSQNRGTLRHARVLDEVNDFRVAAKHRGVYPSMSAVANLDDRVELFFEENIQQFFGLAPDEISLSELVRNPQVKAEIRIAEQLIAKAAYQDALPHLAAAFEFLRAAHAKTLPTRERYDAGLPRELFPDWEIRQLGREFEGPDIQSIFRTANHNWEKLKEQLDVVRLGLDPIAHMRFEIITPTVNFSVSGNREVLWSPGAELYQRKDLTNFCLKFVVDAALRLESVLHLYDHMSSYRVKVIKQSDCHMYQNQRWTCVAVMPPGEDIPYAKPVLVSDVGDHFWMWQGSHGECFIPLDACEIVEEYPIS